MKAVILAAGEGTRLRPFTLTRPKAMIPIMDKPMLEYVISAVSGCDITDIILVVGYHKERVMDYFEDGVDFGVDIAYVKQEQQLGTAHAVKQAQPHLAEGESFLVLNGDNLVESATVKDVMDAHEGDVSLAGVIREKVRGYGVLIVDGPHVKEIVEKPLEEVSNIVNTGIYVFPYSVFEEIDNTPLSVRGEYDITDAIQRMIDSNHEVNFVHSEHMWTDAIYPWDLLDVNAAILDTAEKEVNAQIEENVQLHGDILIGENTVVHSGSYIVGPAVIGDGCEIGPNAVILPSTSIGNNVRVKPFTEIDNSIIMDNTLIGSSSYLRNSIIGENVHLEAHFTAESALARVVLEDEIHQVDVGTIIGENTHIGAGTMASAGTIVGVDCNVAPGKSLGGCIPSGSMVI